MRHVRGVLFLDYVRMLRSQKAVDWAQHMTPEDAAYLATKIEPDAWYPMTTFERFGSWPTGWTRSSTRTLVASWTI